jgi:hypothetical protein
MGQVLAGLLRQRKAVLLPFGDGHRYDLAFDEDGVLNRVQCKTGVLKKGAIVFSVAKVDRTTGVRKSYHGEVEFFGVYCPVLDKTYLVPIDEVGETAAQLRVDPPKNGQEKRVRMASKYEI